MEVHKLLARQRRLEAGHGRVNYLLCGLTANQKLLLEMGIVEIFYLECKQIKGITTSDSSSCAYYIACACIFLFTSTGKMVLTLCPLP